MIYLRIWIFMAPQSGWPLPWETLIPGAKWRSSQDHAPLCS